MCEFTSILPIGHRLSFELKILVEKQGMIKYYIYKCNHTCYIYCDDKKFQGQENQANI